MPFQVLNLDEKAASFPKTLRNGQKTNPRFRQIWAIGNLEILKQPLLGFFCSTKCPGDVILQVYDVARELRNAGVPMIGGFHSPMEKECLELLLRGKQPVVICPARSIENMRVRKEWKKPLEEERLLVLSPFEPKHNRTNAALAEDRNFFVTMLAHEILVIHAPAHSKTHQVMRQALAQGKKILTLNDSTESTLFDAEIERVTASELIDRYTTVNTS